MKVLVIFAALCSVSLAGFLPVQPSADGCPPIQPGQVGICAFMCGVGGGFSIHASECPNGQICCPTACGGTTCVHKHTARETETRAACPPGIMNVDCFVDPCMFAKCDSHPTASCKADYCGGCHANFYMNGHHVNC